MIRLVQFVIVVLMLSLMALVSAITTMHFAIHGAEVKIPDFKGMTGVEAMRRAADLGVELSVDNRYYSAEVPVGRVLTQSPAPGTVVRREWHVRVNESLGPQRVAIPDLMGQEERSAVLQLRRLGLELGNTARMPSGTMPAAKVIAQDPPSGAAGVERPSVSLLLSAEPEPTVAAFVMPNLIGQQSTTAASLIEHAGLKLAPMENASETEAQSTPLPGTIVSQKPPSGYRVIASTPIELTVAR